MDERRHQYATYSFVSRGVKRFADTTSNMVEQYNNVISTKTLGGTKWKALPIISLGHSLIVDSVSRFPGRLQQAKQREMAITAGGEALAMKEASEAGRWDVEITKTTQYTLSGVIGGTSIQLKQAVDPESQQIVGKITCLLCNVTKDWGVPCRHVFALFSSARHNPDHNVAVFIRQHWSSKHRHWYHRAYWTETYVITIAPSWILL